MTERLPCIVFGGSGYVSGELLRLLAAHPRFFPAAVSSTSKTGERVVLSFPHLLGAVDRALTFTSVDDWKRSLGGAKSAVAFFATPHGETAALVDRVLADASGSGIELSAIDLSADFRLRDTELYRTVYGKPHGAPQRLKDFFCGLPEHVSEIATPHVAHPGCFTTAVTLAAYPLAKAGLVDGEIFVSAVTGSSGSGAVPQAGTHHPERAHNFYAYNPLAHRHEHEMKMLLSDAGGGAIEVAFCPHSGPFVRGIHATLTMHLTRELSADAAKTLFDDLYGHDGFVSATTGAPKLAEVVGTNRCRIGVFVRGRRLVVTSVIDNLVKGAAGGAVQWANRLKGLDDHAGLGLAGLGWF